MGRTFAAGKDIPWISGQGWGGQRLFIVPDLDIVIAGLADLAATRDRAASTPALFPRDFAPAPLQLVRNNGNGSFRRISASEQFFDDVPYTRNTEKDAKGCAMTRKRTERLFFRH